MPGPNCPTTSQRAPQWYRHFYVKTTSRRRFDVIMTLSLRHVSARMVPAALWWRHDMDTLVASQTICAPVNGGSHKWPLIFFFNFFVVSPNKLLEEPSCYRWFEWLWCSCDVTVMVRRTITKWRNENTAIGAWLYQTFHVKPYLRKIADAKG